MVIDVKAILKTLGREVWPIPTCIQKEKKMLTRETWKTISSTRTNTERRYYVELLTGGWVVLQPQVNVFLDPKAKASSVGEVLALELVLLHLESSLKDLQCLVAAYLICQPHEQIKISHKENKHMVTQIIPQLGRKASCKSYQRDKTRNFELFLALKHQDYHKGENLHVGIRTQALSEA